MSSDIGQCCCVQSDSTEMYQCAQTDINTLTPNNLKRRRAVGTLKIKIPSKNMREKPTNTPINHSVY
jgi:hypothetical protein